MSIYRTSDFSNLDIILDEVTLSLDKASLTLENIIIMEDFNIDDNTTRVKVEKLN